MTTDVLLFDCDGVLADTEKDCHLPAFNQAFREFGYPIQWTAEEYGRLLKIGGGKERMRSIPREHPEAGFPADPDELSELITLLHQRKTEIYVDIIESGVPGRPGVHRLIKEALDAGKRVAIASTSAEKSVRTVLRAVLGDELAERVTAVYAGDIVPAKKPAPDIYLHAISELGADRESTLVVEDSEAGAAAAAAAGLRHLVTVSDYTADDDFPAASLVLAHLGDEGNPATILAGPPDLPFSGQVDLALIDRLLQTPAH